MKTKTNEKAGGPFLLNHHETMRSALTGPHDHELRARLLSAGGDFSEPDFTDSYVYWDRRVVQAVRQMLYRYMEYQSGSTQTVQRGEARIAKGA